MNFNITNSSDSRGKEKVGDLATLTKKLYDLKTQIKAERVAHVSEKVAKNKCKLEGVLYLTDKLITKEYSSKSGSSSGDMLSFRMNNPLAVLKPQQTFDLDSPDIPEGPIHPTAKLPLVEKIPRFITWVPSDSNKLMVEDQPDEQNCQFSEAEKQMIRFVISQDYKPTEDIIQLLTKFIGGTTSEIHEAFTNIKTENEEMVDEDVTVPTGDQGQSKDLDKSFVDALDSYNALFCRQCLGFDCRRHMIRQPVITPAERAPSNFNPENERPCSNQCYLHLKLQEYPERNRASSISSEPVIIEEPVWKRLEKDLFSIGLEIFGRNSCLITRNMLSGLKTCIQVYKYMHAGQEGPSDPCSTNDHEEPQSPVQRKNKAKRQKHFAKSVARRPALRGSANRNQAKQYTPCDCKSGCGKDCPCLKSSNYCEKYCGCPRSCRNHFRGCHCLKYQCRGQQCSCVVAGRECDPDVCRNCWVSCGGGPLGEPERIGEGQCGNMRLLQKQRERVLMGQSDVAGLGIFLQRAADKDDLIGEYTGELISDEEADARGTLYKDANTSSFLFNLNDQYVIDSIRTGSYLKFANHSANPNCYVKYLKVAGDDRVGIFAKNRIQAGEELFYDYNYPNNLAPVWALKPDDPMEGPSAPQTGARKPVQPSPVQQSPLHPSLFQRPLVHRSRLSQPPVPRSPLPQSPLSCPPLAPPSPQPPMDG